MNSNSICCSHTFDWLCPLQLIFCDVILLLLPFNIGHLIFAVSRPVKALEVLHVGLFIVLSSTRMKALQAFGAMVVVATMIASRERIKRALQGMI